MILLSEALKAATEKMYPRVTTYEIVNASSNLTDQYVHGEYKTVSEAASHLGAACYIVAVENGCMRPLAPEEEAELLGA